MPYEYKKKGKCTQSSGEKGNYIVKKKGAKKSKCYKSKEAFEKSQKYKYWAGIEEKHSVKKESKENKDIQILENYIREIINSIISD